MIESGLVIAQVEAPPPATAPRGINDNGRLASHRTQGVGPAQTNGGAQVVPRHRQPHRVEITPHRPDREVAQRSQFGADGAGRIVYDASWRGLGQPPGPMPCHRRRAGLLQRLVGEKPVRHVAQPGKLGRCPPPQQRRLHQRRCPVSEPGPHRRDIGNTGYIRQRERGDGVQGRRSRLRPQVTDVIAAEAESDGQDGFTPVSMTL